VTVADVASAAGVSLSEAKKQLNVLAQLAHGNLEVSKDGDLVYVFSSSFRSDLLSRSAKKRLQQGWDKVAPVLFYLVKVSFGVALISSIALIFTAILVLQSSSRDDRDDRRGYSSGGGFSFYMGPSYWWGPSPFDIFYFSSSSPYGVNRYENPSQLSFLESVFSFLFGDGNPNANFEQRRYKALANLIRAKGGVVTAEEVAGYLDPPAEPDENKMIDESFVLPALTQLGGVPEVTESGDIVYVFEDLQLSAAAADDQGWEKLSLQELLQLAKSQGISTRGVYDKADLLAVIRAAQDTRSAKSNQEGARANTYLDEKPYQFSLATSGQQLAVGALAAVNLFGALYLGKLFASPYLVGRELIGLLGFVKAIYPFLLAYGIAFVAVPAFRYLKLENDNRKIEKRNRLRALWAFALRKGGRDVERKLAEARRRSQKVKVIKEQDIEYTTGKSIEEQGLDLKEWDAKYLNKEDK